MKKILLHDFRYKIGGSNTVLNRIDSSWLGKKYKFMRITQTETCGVNLLKALREALSMKCAALVTSVRGNT